jgi:hypothetical protein
MRFRRQNVYVDRLREVQRDAGEVYALTFAILTGVGDPWRDMPWDERCARAANEVQQAFLRLPGEENDV